ncbi:MAG: creatininase family protein [Bacillota bacterium]|nr:creatininase family protein [Bacillota bacterium]
MQQESGYVLSTVRLEELRWPEVRQYLAHKDIVVVPAGAVEQHGFHLPLGTDAMVAIQLALDAGRDVGVVVAPPVWYGWSPHHMAYPGTVSLQPDTLISVVNDVCLSLVQHGFRKIVIVNGHRQANLAPLQIAAAAVRQRTGAYVAIVDPFLIGELAARRLRRSAPGGIGHADELETATMMVIRPDLVDRASLVRNVPPASPFHQGDPYVEADRVVVPPTVEEFRRRGGETGVVGDATTADEVMGREYYRALLDNLVAFIRGLETDAGRADSAGDGQGSCCARSRRG